MSKIEEAKRKLGLALASTREVDRESAIHQALAALNSIAANKAAEEGGLPDLRDWIIRNMPVGMVVGDPAWWADRIVAQADRASRQVANKAEVNLSSLERYDEGESRLFPTPDGEYVLLSDVKALLATPPANTSEVEPVPYAWVYECLQPFTDGKVWHELFSHNEPVVGNRLRNVRPLYATPPATTGGANATPTGASTVLTDEQIAETITMKRVDYLADRNACFQRGKEHGQKLVAAQAGQVAVPAIPKGIWYCAEHDNFYENEKGMGQGFYERWSSRAKEFPVAPSPAKESK